MFNSSLDVLYLAIALALILLAIFFCVNLVFLALILRDFSKISEKFRDTATKINEYILIPIKTATNIAGYIGKIADIIEKKYSKNSEKKE